MADRMTIAGSLSFAPLEGSSASGQPSLSVPISEAMVVDGWCSSEYTLTSDSPQSASLGGVTTAALVAVHVSGGKVRVRLTSADGSAQAVPVESLLIVTSETVGYTAVDLTRETGVEVDVRVVVAEKA